jgi:cytosine/adenosine deaminase-related metal-dependent hydrolase
VDVVVEDGAVVSVAPGAHAADASEFRAEGMLAMPGLVNAHTHSPENCLRGIGEGLPLEPWLLLMFGGCGLYDPDAHYTCALAGAAEMLKSGTTACIDHLWMTPPTLEAAAAALRAYRDAGMRAGVAPLMSDVDTTEALALELAVDAGEASFARRLRLLPAGELVAQLDELAARWHGAEGGRLRVLAGPGGVQWCSEELLTGLAEVARRHGSGIQLHLLETATQNAACRLRFGCSAVVALDRLGLLAADTSLAHSVWVDDDDIGLLAERGATVVHNPAANLRLSSGRMPLPEMRAAGVQVAIGTDGSASSDNQSLWECMKLACLLHNETEPGRVTAREVLELATAAGAGALGTGELGTLEPGAPADIVLVDRSGPGLAGEIELEPALVLSDLGRSVRHVFVAGELVVRDGRCTRIDEEAVRESLREQAGNRRPGFSAPSEVTRLAMAQATELRHAVATGGRGVGYEEVTR